MGMRKQKIVEVPMEIVDATAVPGDVAKGKIFYNNLGKQVGNHECVDKIGNNILKTYQYSMGFDNPVDSNYYTSQVRHTSFRSDGSVHYTQLVNKSRKRHNMVNFNFNKIIAIGYGSGIIYPSIGFKSETDLIELSPFNLSPIEIYSNFIYTSEMDNMPTAVAPITLYYI